MLSNDFNKPKYFFNMYRRFLPENEGLPSIAEYLRLIQAQFNLKAWSAVGCNQVKATTNGLRQLLHPPGSLTSEVYEGVQNLWCKVDDRFIIVKLIFGGSVDGIDIFGLDLSKVEALPELDFFRKAIEVIRPGQAYILEQNNLQSLRARRDRKPRPPNWNRVSPLFWFHYIDAVMLEAVGGTSHALQTPVFKVEQFCDGLLFQITQEPLDSENPEHFATQLRAMEHLGITEFRGPPKEQKPLILRPRGNRRKRRAGQRKPDKPAEES